MKRHTIIIVVLVAVVALPVLLLQVVGRRAERLKKVEPAGTAGQLTGDVFIVHPSLKKSFPPGIAEKTIRALLAKEPKDLQPITIDYPENDSLFPPDIVAPTFLWHDDAESDAWLIKVTFADTSRTIHALVPGRRPDPLPLDPTCTQEGGVNIYHETDYQAAARGWRPEAEVWELIKKESAERDAVVEVLGVGGVNAQRPTPNVQRPSLEVLAKGRVTIRTSKDPVGAPIFFRSVPLLDTTKATGVRTTVASVPLIEWKMRNVSKAKPHVLLKDMPTCANCHSFSRDGTTMGMDVDGPGGDKGMYTVSPVKETLEINTENIFTWSDFKHGKRPKDFKIFGFLSRVSPDGQYVVSTVNEALFMGFYPSYKFLQVFFPTMGILGVWSKETGEMFPLPGADDPDYLQSNGTWSPDGKYVYFIRTEAKEPYVKGAPMPTYADDPREREIRYNIYRVPFNDGKGGEAEAINGASHNEKSNYFPKLSPDGKWIVFCQCRNGLLMRPDSELYIVPAEGGEARKMRCNGPSMDSWHTWSPNGKWLAFSSKRNTP
ncbi:MAG: PD40 domain-containing protein, partial [Lentisphaerae bacterium]|nr:PD40 domain-containing protein [Lentisphaerota bacterium]